MGTIRITFILIIVTVLILLILPFQILINLTNLNFKYQLPKYFLRLVRNIIGIKVKIINPVLQNKKYGILYVSNHVTWMDILCLGSILNAQFIAKKEVANMGLFGLLAKLNHTFFIDNTSQRKSRDYMNIFQKKLLDKQNLILFPEGTTSDGNGILEFKSSLFESTNLSKNNLDSSIAYAEVCPISICYKLKNGLPMGLFYRRYVAWLGDYPLLRLMKLFLISGPVSINIIFHNPISLSNFNNRKELSSYCQEIIHNGLTRELMI